MPTPSKKVKLLRGEFWEIRISKRGQTPANSRRSWNLPRRSQSRKPARTPGSAQGTALARGKGSFQKPCPGCGRDEGGEAAQSPFPGQHPWPQGPPTAPGPPGAQRAGDREQGQRCKMQMEEERGEGKEESPREHGRAQCGGTESPVLCRGGPGHRAARQACARPPACAQPITAGWRGSRSQQFPPLSHSKIDSRKKASVFFQVRCKPGKRIQQDLLQHRRLLRSAAVREAFITLKRLPVWHRGILARQERELSGRKLETRWHVSAPSLPREQPGKKLGLGASAADPSTVQESTTESRATLPPVTAPASPVLLQPQAGAQPGQAMLPIPQAGAGQDGPKWLRATVRNSPHAQRPGPPLTLTPQQTVAPPAMRCPTPVSQGSSRIPAPLPSPVSSLGWTSAVNVSQPWGCPQQRQRGGLGRGREVVLQE